MIVSRLRFHSGTKCSIPRCVTWSEIRWTSHNSLVIVPLLTLCFPKSSSWGCLRVLGRHLHSFAQLGLSFDQKAHYFLKHTQTLFLKNTQNSSYSKGQVRNGGSTLKSLGIWCPNFAWADPCTQPDSGRGQTGSLSMVLKTETLPIIHFRSDLFWLGSKFLKTAETVSCPC